jgi:polyisoprenoid-binding protein YceI
VQGGRARSEIVSAGTSTAVSTWAIDASHSDVGFSVRHLMVSNVKGRFNNVTGQLVLDEANPTASSAELSIDVNSVDTRQEQRDAHLRSADFFDAENHSTITFKSTRVVPAGKDEFKVYGDLTIRGVTKEIELKVEYNGQHPSPWGTQVVAVSATGKISRKEFGLTYNPAIETGGVVVGDDVKLSIELEAVKQ